MIGCAGPMPQGGGGALPRMSYEARLGGNDGPERVYRVSALHTGDSAGQRVIFVHGTPGDALAARGYLERPIEGFEFVALDRPGFGETLPRDPVVSFKEQARAIEPLLVERDGKWPILVGHSLGGPIVARVAAEYPERVGGVLILAGSLDPELECPKWFNYAAETVVVRGLLGRPLATSNTEIMAAGRETRELERVLDRVRCPVSVIHGREDGLVPVGNVRYIRERLGHVPSLETTVLAREGHFIPWTQETLVRDRILRLSGTPRDLPAEAGPGTK